MNKYQKLEAFADREIRNLQDKLIVPDDHGGYTAFGKYRIVPSTHGVVVKIKDQTIQIFGNKRVAISWCVADRLDKYVLAHNIKMLDSKKQSLAADIVCRQQLADRSQNEDFYESVTTKVQGKIDYLNMLNTELEKCLNSAKYWQLRGFSNETARPGRTPSIKTNR